MSDKKAKTPREIVQKIRELADAVEGVETTARLVGASGTCVYTRVGFYTKVRKLLEGYDGRSDARSAARISTVLADCKWATSACEGKNFREAHNCCIDRIAKTLKKEGVII